MCGIFFVSEDTVLMFSPERLRVAQAKSGLGNKELAAEVGIKSETTISQWRHGRKRPSLEKQYKLANFFGVQVKDLQEDETDDGRTAAELDEMETEIIRIVRALPPRWKLWVHGQVSKAEASSSSDPAEVGESSQ